MLKGREITDRSLQIDALDGLRGVAALVVFAAHSSNAGMHLFPLINFAGNGKSGVFLFFVLSAFLLTRPFLTEEPGRFSRVGLVSFFFRRCIRIYPLYTVYLLACVVSTMTAWRVLGLSEPQGIPMTLSPIQGLRHFLLIEGIGITWSIAVEFKYYFLLPMVAGILAACRHRIVIATLFLATAIAVCRVIWPDSEYRGEDVRLGFYLPVFLIGSFLALVELRMTGRGGAATPRWAAPLDIAALCALVGLFMLVPDVAARVTGKTHDLVAFHRQIIPFAFLWGVVLLAAITRETWTSWILRLPVVRFFGFISFSFYLFHPVFLEGGKFLVARAGLLPTIAGWLALAACTAGSWVTFRLIERPTSRWRLLRR